MLKNSQFNFLCHKNLIITTLLAMLFSFSVRAQPSFNASFIIDEIGPGSTTTLIYTIDNTDPVNPVSDLAFINVLPAGLIIATPSQAISECINGLLVAPEGGGTITFTDGRIAAATDCTIRLNIESSIPGTYTNTTGDLTSDAGNSGTATANLTVNAERPGFTKNFSPSTVNFGDRSTLTFNVDNSINTNDARSLRFTDDLPVGMVIADPANVFTDCPDPINVITAIPGSQQLSYFPPNSIPALMAGATCSVSVDVLAQARGRLNNTSSNLTSIGSSFTLEDSGMAGDVLMVNSIGDIQLTQSFLDDPVLPGDEVVLEFELTSLNRNFDVTDINFTNDLNATLSGLVATGLPLNDVCGMGSTISGTSLLSLNGASLNPNETCSFSVTLQVPAVAPSGVYPNPTSQPTGQVTGQPTNGNIATDNLFVNFAPQLTKSFTPDILTPGETTSMEFTITNPSVVDTATEISFTDNLSAFMSGATVVALPAAGSCGAGSNFFTSIVVAQTIFNMTGANLAPGDSCTFSVDLNTASNTPPGTYTNTTQAITANLSGQVVTGKQASADLTIRDIPELSMNFNGDPVTTGGTIDVEYRISGFDEGNLNATDISFDHDLDATLSGLEAVGLPLNDVCGTGSQLSGTGQIALTNGSISNGSVCEFTVTLQVPTAAANGSYTSTTSALTSMVNGENITANTATDSFTVSSLEFSHQFIDDPTLPGDTVILEYTIDNLGTDDATGMFFTHNLPGVVPGLTAVAPLPTNPCGAGSSLSGTTFLILVGADLTAGSSCTFAVSLTVPPNTPNNNYGSFTSALTATLGGAAVTTPASNDTLIIDNNLIFFSKAFSDNPVTPGNTTSLEFTLVNGGDDDMSGLNFEDDLDAVLGGLVATGLPLNDVCGLGSQISGTNLLSFTGGNIPVGDSCIFSIDVIVPNGALSGAYPNITTEVDGTLSGLPVMGDPARDELMVGFFSLTKSFDGPVFSGDTAVLSFTITNNDISTISGLSFSDDLEAVLSGLTAVAPLPTNPCGAGSQITGNSVLGFSNGQVAANSTCTFDVTVQIPAGLSDSTFTNITSDLIQTGVPLAAPAIATLQVMGVPVIDVSPLTVSFGDVEVGNTSTLQTVTVSNTGLGGLNISNLPDVSVDVSTTITQAGSSTCPFAPFVLAPSGSCTLDYEFSPTAAGTINGTSSITSNSTGSNTDTDLTFTGTGTQAILNLNPNPLDFGITEVNTTSTAIVLTVSNNGTADLNVSSVTAAAGDFSIDSNTCGAAPFSLAPASSCTIGYQFNPTTTGSQTQNIVFVSNSATTPDTAVLQGDGQIAALTLSTAQVSFPDTLINTDNQGQISLNNSGLVDVEITALTGALAPFALNTSGSCSALPIVLTPSSSCTLGYSFSPTVTGNFNQTLSLTSNAGSSPDTFELVGEGIEPLLTLDAANLDFGSINVNDTSTALTMNLSNTGTADLTINNISAATAPFTRSGGSCGAFPVALTPSQNCTLEYQFAPTTTGNFNQTINIQSDATSSPDTFGLIGVGIEPGLQLSQTSLDFQSIEVNDTSTPLSMTITNSGTADLIINDIGTPAAPYTRIGGSCATTFPITLTMNQNCTLEYQFAPTTTGTLNQNINIQSNAATSPDSFELTGIGIAPELTLSSTNLDFGPTQVNLTSNTLTMSISNSGTADLSISDISTPAAPFTRLGGSCVITFPIALAMGQNCTLEYQFTPTSTADFSQIITIQSNASTSPDTFELTGTGVEFTLELSATDLDFGTWSTNTTSNTLTMTLSNTGTEELNIIGLSQVAAPFVVTGGNCGTVLFTLASGQNCTLDYQFTPTASGVFSQTIEISSNASTSPDSFTLIGIGSEIILGTSNDNVVFEFTAVDEVQSQTLTLSSDGADDVVISAISSPTAATAFNPNKSITGAGNPFDVDFSDCGALPITLSNGDSCQMVIIYITEATASNSSFTIASNDPNSPLVVNLRGTGIIEPVSVPVMNSLGLAVLLLLLILFAYRRDL